MYLYKIINTLNNNVYIGITRTSINRRWTSHVYCARHNTKSILYDAMRSYGIENFIIETIKQFDNEQDLLQAEKNTIEYYRHLLGKTYNILDGGESYFPIKNKEAWKTKLKEKRQGRKPSLGMHHTEENKKLFGMYGKQRWDKYGRYPDEVLDYKFSEAHEKFGISKTHYYRLRNRMRANDSH